MTQQVDWKRIAGDLADSLADYNHSWASETRGSMYSDSHTAMVAYYEAAGFNWREWCRGQYIEVCECHAEQTSRGHN